MTANQLLDHTINEWIPDDCIDDDLVNDAQQLINAIDNDTDRLECVKMIKRFWGGYNMASNTKSVRAHHDRLHVPAYRLAFRRLTLL